MSNRIKSAAESLPELYRPTHPYFPSYRCGNCGSNDPEKHTGYHYARTFTALYSQIGILVFDSRVKTESKLKAGTQLSLFA